MNKKLLLGIWILTLRILRWKNFFKTVGKSLNGRNCKVFDKKSKGFGFVEMNSIEEAKIAIEKLNGSEFRGRKIVVSEFKEIKKNLKLFTNQLCSTGITFNHFVCITRLYRAGKKGKTLFPEPEQISLSKR